MIDRMQLDWDLETRRAIYDVLVAIADGYPVSGVKGFLVVVENPAATPENIAMRGVPDNLTINVIDDLVTTKQENTDFRFKRENLEIACAAAYRQLTNGNWHVLSEDYRTVLRAGFGEAIATYVEGIYGQRSAREETSA